MPDELPRQPPTRIAAWPLEEPVAIHPCLRALSCELHTRLPPTLSVDGQPPLPGAPAQTSAGMARHLQTPPSSLGPFTLQLTPITRDEARGSGSQEDIGDPLLARMGRPEQRPKLTAPFIWDANSATLNAGAVMMSA